MRTTLSCCAAVAAALVSSLAAAQAPGEDPVVLNRRVGVQMQPTPQPPKSGDINNTTDMPAWMRAKVARYQARSLTMQDEILTDVDAVTTSAAQGLRKTCVQEIGSNTQANNTPGMKYGPQQKEQIVVLRGDLVNICN